MAWLTVLSSLIRTPGKEPGDGIWLVTTTSASFLSVLQDREGGGHHNQHELLVVAHTYRHVLAHLHGTL